MKQSLDWLTDGNTECLVPSPKSAIFIFGSMHSKVLMPSLYRNKCICIAATHKSILILNNLKGQYHHDQQGMESEC